jgi:hypothetical protein
MFFMAAAPARADLVQLNWTHGKGERLAHAAGGTASSASAGPSGS